MDETNVQQEPSSTTENTQEPSVQPQPLTEERIQQMIADATARAVEEGKRLGRTELQSQQDRNKAEVARLERRAQMRESTLGAVRSRVRSLDPEVANELELIELRAEQQERSTRDQEEVAARTQQEFHSAFTANQQQLIKDLGIDPEDKRVDWALDAPNYIEAMRRTQASAVSIQKETLSTREASWEQRLRALETQVRGANVDANSVDTATSNVVAVGSEADFLRKFGSGDLPMTQTNIDRYNKITGQYS